jgi:hypothetical protein
MIVSASEFVMFLCIAHGVMSKFKSKVLDKVLYIVANIATTGMIETFLNNEITSNATGIVLNYLFLMVYLRKNGRKDMESNTFMFLLSYILILAIQLFIVLILNAMLPFFEISFKYGLIAQGLGLIVLFSVMKFQQFKNIDYFTKQKNAAFRMIVATVFTIYYSLVILWYLNSAIIIDNRISILIILLLVVLINTLLSRNALIGKMSADKLALYDTYFLVIDTVFDELRKSQHDFANHIQTIKAMKKKSFEDENSIERYIDEVEKSTVMNDIIKMENKILAAFLYSKYWDAKDKNVEIKFDIKHTVSNNVYKECVLVEIFGVLIDNAVEATLEYGKSKYVRVITKTVEGKNILEVGNPYRYTGIAQLKMFLKSGYSTKETTGKGLGLSKLKTMIERKKDMLSVRYDDSLEEIIVAVSITVS